MPQQRFPIPLPLILIDGFGALLLAFGIVGLTGGVAGMPALSMPVVAWTLVGMGGMIMLASVVLIAMILSNHARARRQQGDTDSRRD